MKKIIIALFIATLVLISTNIFCQTIVLQENFTTYQGTSATVPTGWIFNYNGYYSTAGSSGTSGPNSYKFGVNNATITTPAFTTADSVHFWIKGLSTTTSQLVIKEGADTNSWTTVATINPLPTTGTAYVYHINSSSHRLRFVYTKVAGNVAFDDFLLTKNGSVSTSNHIKIYFNKPVNTSVSSGTNAVYLNSCADDTLIAYINRAKFTIDVAVYNYIQTGAISNIATAINNAYTRGVHIRWIYDGGSSNSGLSSLNSNIHTLGSPTSTGYGIMHNKFAIIDANSTTASDAIVWTGSTNWNDEQFNTDINNVVIIQNQPLAQAYTTEFNEMWGGTGLTPNTTNSKFGPDKTDNTPHSFTIDGKTVELYFSPSDGTNSHIQSTINSANSDLFFGVYTFTDNTDANLIKTKINSGIYCAGIMDQYSQSFAAYTTLNPVMGNSLKIYTQSNSIFHSKYVIVDACDVTSDPQVLTGSHNWTVSADTQNDENTLIIHDATTANIYYQSFYQNFYNLGGTLSACVTTNTDELPTAATVQIFPNPANDKVEVNGIDNATIEIMNMQGQLVKTLNTLSKSTIDISQLPNGVYMMRIISDNGIVVKKFIKEN